MMQHENHSLLPYNTFGIDAQARYFIEVTSIRELSEWLVRSVQENIPVFILGGGSNVLLTQDIPGRVIRIGLKGIEVIKEDQDHVWVKAMAGEVWHPFVLHCIAQGWAGIENLSLIPGTVGAAPMQNIGAYGVEIKDVFHELEAVDVTIGEVRTFSHQECRFGYRESVFKQELKNKYAIASVTFRLNKQPQFNTSYGAIKKTLEEMNIRELSIKAISDAVIHIRSSKLPDPANIGNAGSFFKNPEIPNKQFHALKSNHPNIVGYPVGEDRTKVAAGWLIEQCGWKGKRVGNTGSHKDQALVLVNYGQVEGHEVATLAADIQASVKERFGIELKTEVNII